jgi:FAD/FMN-containing dehydrogenase
MSVTKVMEALPGLAWTTDPALVRQKSRDFFWYSPVLKRQLNKVTGEAVVTPRNEDEVKAVLAVAYAHGVPVTARGAGTGNYGQAMPLQGGIVLELTAMNRVLWAKPAVMRAEAGIKLIDLDAQLKKAVGAEIRCHPSTLRTATLGGFVAGGSGGVGSTSWGGLREPGNILGLKVITMEAEPRVLELRGTEITKANHAYGTNGIITELEMGLAPAHDWVDVVVAFPTLMAAARFGDAFTKMDGIPKKLACIVPAPIPQLHFKAWGAKVPAGQSVACLMVDASYVEVLSLLVAGHGGTVVHQEPTAEAAVPLYEHSWNHTTLQILKTDKTITYLQALFPAPNHLDLIAKLEKRFGDEVLFHLEFVRFSGVVCAVGLQIVRFTTEERLNEIMRIHEEEGAPIFNPHVYTLEDGGMKRVDEEQLDFKRLTDPKGLLNPGKMAAWNNPDWKPGKPGQVHLYETEFEAPAEVLE